MRKLVLCGASLLSLGCAQGAMAKGATSAAPAKAAGCDARYYNYLVGKGVYEARAISGSDYRVLAAGAARGAPKAKRMTITVDQKNTIVAIDCG